MLPGQGFVSPARLVKTSQKEPAAGTGERPGLQHVCALVRVNLVTTWSQVRQDLSHRIYPTASSGSALGRQVIPVRFILVFFPIFWELQVLMGPNPHALGKSLLLALGLERLLNENKTRIF